jgi:hypothetical protein
MKILWHTQRGNRNKRSGEVNLKPDEISGEIQFEGMEARPGQTMEMRRKE